MASLHIIAGALPRPAHPAIRKIGVTDLRAALASGIDDFLAMPSHTVFVGLIYPIVGFMLGGAALGHNVLPLLFPLAAGFALVGPIAAVGLYEMSRRREMGLRVSWRDAFGVLRSPSIGAIAGLGVLLMLIFLAWLASAQAIYESLFGDMPPASISQFVHDVLTTKSGHGLIAIGCGIGFLFAVVVLTISAISFPLLLDADVGAAVAMLTSVRVVAANPATMALWGLIVAALLVIGSLPFFVGLAIVVPILGHATWHLYRRAVKI
ncbi:MAG TPA: DUF2189 domain-containing protein [Xanthobacteraceae bacterium]|jgi:uncharacterized membrane protein|nr:DUF2189 domain-containing protein [Xanthobacteraceae bacterium]